jgi:hypothetical protein
MSIVIPNIDDLLSKIPENKRKEIEEVDNILKFIEFCFRNWKKEFQKNCKLLIS